MAHVSIKKYGQVKVNSIQEMTPYEQIKLIYTNLLTRLAVTKGFIERKEIEKKGENISACILLFGALQDTLNFEVEGGSEISDNLFSLYDYCQRKLSEANINNDTGALAEVSTIVKEIKEGWDNIPEDKRQQSANA